MFCFQGCGLHYDWRLLILAVCICSAGSWITIRVFSRARACGDGGCRTAWVFLSGVPAGATVWTTHFVGMAAVWPDLAFAFEPTLMILSLFVAIISTISGFAIAASRRIKITGEIGGAVVGLGICAMHYTGTAAVRAGAPIQLDPKFVALSILFGAVMGAVALNRVIRPITCYCKYGAASALTLAICGMHVIGWMAIEAVPGAAITVPLQVTSSGIFIIAVASVGLLVIGTGLSSYLLDDRARAEAQTRFDHLAKHDTLTGLPNRISFYERLDLNMALAKSQHGRLAVLCMNLSRFKEINDFFGYHAGDRVLVEITQRIGLALGDGAFLARLGGDEFAVIQISKALPQDALMLAERIRKTFEDGFVVGAKPIPVGINIGISVFPDDGQDREQLMANADVALERARADGVGSICLFEQAMDETVQRRRTLSRDLGVAIENGELEVYYQVQAAVDTSAISGFEALVRWRHPVLGMISPVEFIPLAEDSGLIAPLGEWVLRTACRDAAAWPQSHNVAVNLSPLQLENDELPTLVEDVLAQTGLDPQRLELEITESTLMRDVERAVAILGRFKALGVSLAVDDFGTGYSSLSTLQLFPFDKIKLDRSFLGEGKTKAQHRAIVRAVISLARCLSMKVLAEGVETHDHLAFLREESCDEVQGYLLSKPMPLSSIQHLVTARACPIPPAVNEELMLMAG